jgi:hypothetical protein
MFTVPAIVPATMPEVWGMVPRGAASKKETRRQVHNLSVRLDPLDGL